MLLLAYLHIGSEQLLELERLRERHLLLQQILLPRLEDELAPKLPRERAHVGQKGRAQQAVAQQLDPLVLQLLQVDAPSLVLRTQAVDELVGGDETPLHNGRLLLEAILLLELSLELLGQVGQLRLDLGHLVVDLVELARRVVVLLLESRHLVLLGLDLAIHRVVADHGVDELEQAGARNADRLHLCDVLGLLLRLVLDGQLEVLLEADGELLDGRYLAIAQIVEVHLLQVVQEVGVGHEALRRAPVDLANALHDHDAVADGLDGARRILERAYLGDLLLAELVERQLGRLERRQRLLERHLGLALLLVDHLGLLLDLFALDERQLLLLGRLGRAARDLLEQRLDLLRALAHLDLLHGQVVVEHLELDLGLLDLLDADEQAVLLRLVLAVLALQHAQIGADVVQVVLRRRVVLATQLGRELLAVVLHTLMRHDHVRHQLFALIFRHTLVLHTCKNNIE